VSQPSLPQSSGTDLSAEAEAGSIADRLLSRQKLFVVETFGFCSADKQELLETHLHCKCALKCMRRVRLGLVEEKCVQFVETVDCYDS